MRRRRHVEGDVQLNMAAMLDMAFQLLAFFILTYQPGKVEGCISVRMPPATPVTKPDTSGGAANAAEATALAGAVSLQITVTANKEGGIAGVRVGEHAPVTDLREVEQQLRAITRVAESPFDQVLLKVNRNLEYENVLKVIEICARNKLTSGDQQTKVSIIEMP
jgi:biopolymer transport protein ExbD